MKIGRAIWSAYICECLFGLKKKSRFRILISNGKAGEEAMVWFAKVVLLLQSKSKRGSVERNVGFVQYMRAKATLDAVKKTLGCICMRWSVSEEKDHSGCGR